MATPTLVLLHPFPTDAGFWDDLRPHLPGWTLLTPEAPGFGASPSVPDWQIADWADEVAGVIHDRCDGGRAVVCGLSMGGYAALALAARHGDMLDRLILADTRAEADTDEAREARVRGIARIRDEGTAGYLAELLPRLVAPGTDAAVTERLRVIAARQSPHAVTAALSALAARPDRTADLARIRVPVLALVGEHDDVTPPDAARRIADGVHDGTMEVLPGVGHMSALEHPANFALAVLRHCAAPGRS